MSAIQTTTLYEVVAEMQASMEESGFSSELVDQIVSRGLSILFGAHEDSYKTSQLTSSST